MAPQRAGPQEITPAVMKIASRGNSRDAWGQWVSGLKWKSYFSNTLKFNVKPLPTDITLVGDFKITALVDKTTVDANEAVNLVVKISGDGNFEDIETLKPRIANASIFDEEPKVESQIENQNYRAQLTQKMAIISSEDFTIPPIVLKYFDPKEKLVKVLTTEAIKVHVNGGVVSSLNEEVKIQRADIHSTPVEVKTVSIERPFSMLYLILALFIGVMLGVTLSLLPWKKLLNKEKEQKMNLKDYKTLLVQLIPYKENSEVHKVISALEAHLYEGKELSIDKKVLKDMANRLRKDLL